VPNSLSAVVFIDNASDGIFQPGDALQPGVELDLVLKPIEAPSG
jgi:hypothetical protein